MNTLAASLILLALLASEGKPTPKLPLGKETTYVTGPLDKDGYVDYAAALNERMSRGITPDKNANVLLWKALGPAPSGDREMPEEFFKLLGVKKPAKNGDYFIGLTEYMRVHLKLDAGKFATIEDQQSRAAQRPWKAKDYPHVASWLKANDKPLAVVVEATTRPDYYNPLVTRPEDKGPGALMGALLPGAQKCRHLVQALSCRAMLRVAEGKSGQAWQDLLACHRLARLVSRGATLIETLLGLSLDAAAANADLAYLEGARLSRRQIQECLADLQGLPPMPSVADKITLEGRFTYLDSVQMIRRGGVGMIEGLAGGKARKPDAEEQKALSMIDWTPALRDGNRWYDRVVAALRANDRAGRKKAFDRIYADMEALKDETLRPENLAQILYLENPPSKTVGKVIGNVLIKLLMPAAGKIQDAHDRGVQIQRNLHVAFALAAYRLDHRRFPARLEELAPTYLAVVPGDLFSGKALRYRPTDKGYLVYSVGPNGKDEGGRWLDDNPPGDDPGVRMPLPELKKRK